MTCWVWPRTKVALAHLHTQTHMHACIHTFADTLTYINTCIYMCTQKQHETDTNKGGEHSVREGKNKRHTIRNMNAHTHNKMMFGASFSVSQTLDKRHMPKRKECKKRIACMCKRDQESEGNHFLDCIKMQIRVSLETLVTPAAAICALRQ
jgi:hypothetical protein